MAVEDFVGFGVRGFRSYGGDLQVVGPMSKVHLIAGKNNVGKSNLLRALAFIVRHVAISKQMQFRAAFPSIRDTPEGWAPQDTRQVAVGLRLNANLRSLFSLSTDNSPDPMLRLLRLSAFSRGFEDVVWFEYDVIPDDAANSVTVSPSQEQLLRAMAEEDGSEGWLMEFMGANFTSNSSDAFTNWTTILRNMDPWTLVPKLEWIEAKRSVGAADTLRPGDTGDAGFHNGRGFIPQLLALQNPETENYRRDRPKFDALETLVQSVLDDPKARISVPGSGTDLQITTGGKLESYRDIGTGLTEVVHIAAMATSVSGHVLSIEEPEIHLHPTLQRLLVTYLAEKTDNHYVISTHSASMLDAEVASISHVSLDSEGWSRVSPVTLRRDRAAVVADLGNRASDLVQSNYVVWVEGPSDRLYISHWIRESAPELLEGANFSVMFYGGGLLNHLTANDDDEVSSFIELAQINRHFAVIIDSDRSNENQLINATKQRVVDELSASGGVVWVTSGYTIENYIPAELLRSAVDAAYEGKSYVLPSGHFESPLGSTFKDHNTKPNKVTVARKVVARGMQPEAWTSDLPDRIAELVAAIRKANGLT